MDMNTGRIYPTKEAAEAAGVAEGDLMRLTEEQQHLLSQIPQTLQFKKSPFGTIKSPEKDPVLT